MLKDRKNGTLLNDKGQNGKFMKQHPTLFLVYGGSSLPGRLKTQYLKIFDKIFLMFLKKNWNETYDVNWEHILSWPNGVILV